MTLLNALAGRSVFYLLPDRGSPAFGVAQQCVAPLFFQILQQLDRLQAYEQFELFHSCNSMLGYAKDDVRTLSAAIEYLKSTASSAESNACGEEGSGSGCTTGAKPASVKQEVSTEPV